jgi:hypothetical protein
MLDPSGDHVGVMLRQRSADGVRSRRCSPADLAVRPPFCFRDDPSAVRGPAALSTDSVFRSRPSSLLVPGPVGVDGEQGPVPRCICRTISSHERDPPVRHPRRRGSQSRWRSTGGRRVCPCGPPPTGAIWGHRDECAGVDEGEPCRPDQPGRCWRPYRRRRTVAGAWWPSRRLSRSTGCVKSCSTPTKTTPSHRCHAG